MKLKTAEINAELSACFKSVKKVEDYKFCPDEKEAKPKS